MLDDRQVIKCNTIYNVENEHFDIFRKFVQQIISTACLSGMQACEKEARKRFEEYMTDRNNGRLGIYNLQYTIYNIQSGNAVTIDQL